MKINTENHGVIDFDIVDTYIDGGCSIHHLEGYNDDGEKFIASAYYWCWIDEYQELISGSLEKVLE